MASANGDTASLTSDAYSTADEYEDAVHDDRVLDAPAIGYPDAEEMRRRQEADQHVANYVQDQLERVRSNGSASSAPHDEIMAGLDGQVDGKFS